MFSDPVYEGQLYDSVHRRASWAARLGLLGDLVKRWRRRIATDPGEAPAVDVWDAVLRQDMQWLEQAQPAQDPRSAVSDPAKSR